MCPSHEAWGGWNGKFYLVILSITDSSKTQQALAQCLALCWALLGI